MSINSLRLQYYVVCHVSVSYIYEVSLTMKVKSIIVDILI